MGLSLPYRLLFFALDCWAIFLLAGVVCLFVMGACQKKFVRRLFFIVAILCFSVVAVRGIAQLRYWLNMFFRHSA